MKTLYVTDLDGTLLNSSITVSEKSKSIINSLVDRGMSFTFATARSLVSAKKVTDGLKLKLPVVVYNGAFIMDYNTGEVIHSCHFSNEEVDFITGRIQDHSLNPLVYSFIKGKECVSYNSNFVNEGTRLYLKSRKGDKRLTPLDSNRDLYSGEVFYFTIISKEKELIPFYNEVCKGENLRVTLQQDIYNEYFWCEIMPKNASKAHGVLKLKEIIGAEKIVSFGDALNDIPMFLNSQECYAVSNGVKELKDISTKEILSNNQDGVALWLKENY
ncbi:MAG: HAD family hydrolase, partial [Ruminococcus sp.]